LSLEPIDDWPSGVEVLAATQVDRADKVSPKHGFVHDGSSWRVTVGEAV